MVFCLKLRIGHYSKEQDMKGNNTEKRVQGDTDGREKGFVDIKVRKMHLSTGQLQ